jgi:hypothetical protein
MQAQIERMDFGVVPEIMLFVKDKQHLITSLAHTYMVSPRDLTVTALLYLPRLMKVQFPTDQEMEDELKRLCQIIRERTQYYGEWNEPPSPMISSPQHTVFGEVTPAEAQVIHERFHYISSFRSDSQHFGLKTQNSNKIVALASLSPFDLHHVEPLLPATITPDRVCVISRVYSFDWAPRNTTSYLLGHVQRHVAQQDTDIAMLLTYVNPNLGFSGASFRAANWLPFGREDGTRYCYLDGEYITDRKLERLFGTSNPTQLRRQLGTRFEESEIWLAPLLLLAFYFDRETIAAQDHSFQRIVHRP